MARTLHTIEGLILRQDWLSAHKIVILATGLLENITDLPMSTLIKDSIIITPASPIAPVPIHRPTLIRIRQHKNIFFICHIPGHFFRAVYRQRKGKSSFTLMDPMHRQGKRLTQSHYNVFNIFSRITTALALPNGIKLRIGNITHQAGSYKYGYLTAFSIIPTIAYDQKDIDWASILRIRGNYQTKKAGNNEQQISAMAMRRIRKWINSRLGFPQETTIWCESPLETKITSKGPRHTILPTPLGFKLATKIGPTYSYAASMKKEHTQQSDIALSDNSVQEVKTPTVKDKLESSRPGRKPRQPWMSTLQSTAIKEAEAEHGIKINRDMLAQPVGHPHSSKLYNVYNDSDGDSYIRTPIVIKKDFIGWEKHTPSFLKWKNLPVTGSLPVQGQSTIIDAKEFDDDLIKKNQEVSRRKYSVRKTRIKGKKPKAKEITKYNDLTDSNTSDTESTEDSFAVFDDYKMKVKYKPPSVTKKVKHEPSPITKIKNRPSPAAKKVKIKPSLSAKKIATKRKVASIISEEEEHAQEQEEEKREPLLME
ncbi:hypothetical protein MKZ38_007064 [Zalerion maritima]|uniref:Uncharacterized protein n=1 Tax=Zalerion maritima TaxID=339359 RepID=A0AAD5WNG1_9PEZI|nr:hypothetical protein MKZ38_007064 [Zalerion maritima]